MLEFSLLLNFVLFCALMFQMDKINKLTKTLVRAASNGIYGGKTAWHQYHYILQAYIDLRRYKKELEGAFTELWMDVQAKDPIINKSQDEIILFYLNVRKIFSRDWSLRQFPKYGPKELSMLSNDFKEQLEKQTDYYG